MTQGNASGSGSSVVTYENSSNLDAFSRLRVSNPTALFDAQLTYNLQPLVMEQVTNGAGATITHDTTNRNALMTFLLTPTGGLSYMQSYEYIRYQPGKSQLIFLSFNFLDAVADVTKFAGYGDGVNGIELHQSETDLEIILFSDTSVGDQLVSQADWNLDPLDGKGPSGLTFDVSKIQILVIDFQALYSGRVRVGFDMEGAIVYVHEFNAANTLAFPYIQDANLPVRCGMSCTGTATTTMNYICSSVSSEGGTAILTSPSFTVEAAATAASGARTYLMSVRPKTTFNGITNRSKFSVTGVNVLVTGTNPVLWELCIGQAVTTPVYGNVNTTYSSTEYDAAGTLSGAPAIVVASGYVASSNQTKGSVDQSIVTSYPITLDAAGAVRANGTLTLLVTGVGGSSAMRGSIAFMEER